VTVFPANVKIITEGASAVPAGLFNQNATGRVTPLGEFVGFQDSIEYFFGLAPLPTSNARNNAFSNATLAEFTSGCPEVAASVVYLTLSTFNPDNSTGPFITVLKEVCIRVCSYVCPSWFKRRSLSGASMMKEPSSNMMRGFLISTST
jgi:hypothetical protein